MSGESLQSWMMLRTFPTTCAMGVDPPAAAALESPIAEGNKRARANECA
jgi:hypothetical protein